VQFKFSHDLIAEDLQRLSLRGAQLLRDVVNYAKRS